jgi:peroxiredoxin
MTNPIPRFTLAVLVLLLTNAGCDRKDAAPAPAPASEPPAAAPAQPQPAPEKAAEPAPSPAPAPPAGALTMPELGKPAPEITLTDTEGKAYRLSELRGKTVVLEWFNPDCPFVKFAHGEGELKTMAKKVMNDSLVWLSINSSAPGKQGNGIERNRAARTEYGMENPVLLDENGVAGRSYGAAKTPTLFIVSKDGTLIYRGGIDNAPIGKVDPERPRLPDSKEDQLVNYVKAALDDQAANRALRLPDTPAYGCSVKYQS